jgi:hypothetical protein
MGHQEDKIVDFHRRADSMSKAADLMSDIFAAQHAREMAERYRRLALTLATASHWSAVAGPQDRQERPRAQDPAPPQ